MTPARPPKQQTEGARTGVWKCRDCPLVFDVARKLSAHRRIKHPGAMTAAKRGRPKTSKFALICPECKDSFASTKLMGSHRRFAHGVPGSSITSKWHQRKKEREAQAEAAPSTAIAVQPQQQGAVTNGSHSKKSNGHATPIELIAYTVGKLEEVCHGLAFQNGLPAKQFARECSEYFHLSASR